LHPQQVTIQGKAGVLVDSPDPNESGVAWLFSDGTALVVSGYKVSDATLLAVAGKVIYEAGAEFVYPARPRITVTRQQALDKLPGSASTKRAVLTSFGEIDAATHSTGPLNHRPTLASAVEVIRPVWVVWTGTVTKSSPTTPQDGIVVDANSAALLAQLKGVDPDAFSSLTDRSLPGCAPPLGVLSRTEFQYLRPAKTGTINSARLTTLQELLASKVGNGFGSCGLLTCDPSVPIWLWISTTSNPCFGYSGPPPISSTPNRPTPLPGSWELIAFDARTGSQNTMPGGAGGCGPLPPEVTTIPDLAYA
jgi:hypothetical protein